MKSDGIFNYSVSYMGKKRESEGGHGSDTGEEKVVGMGNPGTCLLWSRFVLPGLAPAAWSNMLDQLLSLCESQRI